MLHKNVFDIESVRLFFSAKPLKRETKWSRFPLWKNINFCVCVFQPLDGDVW